MKKVEQLKICIHCNTPLQGSYCYSCGQKEIKPEDKKLKYFIEEFFSSLFVADGKVLATFRDLLIRPGVATKTFIAGNRKKYLSPLRVFFFANLIYFLFPLLNTFSTNLNTQLTQQMYSGFATETVKEHLQAASKDYVDYRTEFESKSNNLGKLLLILLVLIQAFVMRLILIRRRDLFAVDFLSAASYFTSFYILFLLVLLPFLVNIIKSFSSLNFELLLNNSVVSLVFLVGIIFYLTAFFKNGFSLVLSKSILGAIVLGFSMIPTFIIYRFVLFLATHYSIV